MEETLDVKATWDALAAERDAGESPPSPAAETEAPAQQEPVQAAQPAPPADPFAGVPDVVRQKLAKLDQLETRIAQREREYSAAIGRVATLQREVEQAKKLMPQAGIGPSRSEIAEAAKSPQKWEAMKADFPDWGEAIEAMVAHRLGSQPKAAEFDPARVDEIVQARLQLEREAIRNELEHARVDMRFPDWRDKVNTAAFNNWFGMQSAEVKALSSSPKAADAIKLLDLFEKSTAKPAAEVKTERHLKLAAAATTRPGQTPPPKSEEDMSPEELWNYLAKKRLSA